MTKVTLNDVGNLIDATTAQTTINNNNETIVEAFDNTLSRDGSQPNKMASLIDMDSNPIINLPVPIGGTSPLRLEDLTNFIGGGTIQAIPGGGVTGQSLQKASNTNYDVTWGNSVSSVGLSLPADFTITGSPVVSSGTLTGNWTSLPTGTGSIVRGTSPVISTPTLSNPTVTTGTFTSPTLVTPALGTPTSGVMTNVTGLPVSTGISGLGTGVATFLATPSSANLATAVTNETGSGALVFGTSPSLTTPSFSSIVNTGTLTLPTSTDTLVGRATTDTLTNKTLTSPILSGVALSAGQYPGETTTGSATAGNVGEYIESILVSGSATSLVTSTAKTVTSITLTAGDWDVCGTVYFTPNSLTTISLTAMGISNTNNTLDLTAGRWAQKYPAVNPGGQSLTDCIHPVRISITGSTTIYLIGYCTFLTNTCSAWGIIRARRVR